MDGHHALVVKAVMLWSLITEVYVWGGGRCVLYCKPLALQDSKWRGVEQQYSLSKAQVKHDRWVVDRYVIGFAPALTFLRSQILCRLYKSPSDETVNRGPPYVYACKKITYAR